MRRWTLAACGLLVVSGVVAEARGAPPPRPSPPKPSVSTTPTAAAAAPVATSFEELEAGAKVIGFADLEGITWALTATCADGDELARRQCRWVRDARLAALGPGLFSIAADAGALTAGAWDDAAQGLPLELRGCIACRFAVVANGVERRVASGRGAEAMVDGAVRGSIVYQGPRVFSGQAAAERWRAEALPRLKVQLIVRLSAGAAWSEAGANAIAVDVVGYRVHDPCSGQIVAASPPAQRAAGDARICGKAVVAAGVDKDRPRLPDQLAPADIRAALAPAEAAAHACFDTYGVAGEAVLRLGISDAGAVLALEQDGDFTDTPTGECIERAVRAVSFPRTRRARTTITYPIVLR